MGVHPAAGGDKPDDRRRLTVAGNTFPDGFLWGTSSAAHQVEGDNRNCEWWEFEQEPGRIANGDTSAIACDHYHRYREDFALLRELSQGAHRLSIEWSRIEPSEGEFDSLQILSDLVKPCSKCCRRRDPRATIKSLLNQAGKSRQTGKGRCLGYLGG